MKIPLWLSALLTIPAFGQTAREPLFTSFDGTKIHYDVRGNGYPVVLVHGFMGSSAAWKANPLVDSLLKAGFQVVTLDTRGNGQSDHPHTPEAYDADAEARDVIGLMAHLKANQYDILGYSRGAILTARVLVLDPHVRKGVLGGMGADFTNPNWPRRIAFYEAFAGKSYQLPELKGIVARAKTNGADTLALAYQQRSQPSTSPAELGRIRKPVLVIAGDRDEDNGKADDLARMLPNATRKTVPGDHGGTARTAAFAEAVVAFLKR